MIRPWLTLTSLSSLKHVGSRVQVGHCPVGITSCTDSAGRASDSVAEAASGGDSAGRASNSEVEVASGINSVVRASSPSKGSLLKVNRRLTRTVVVLEAGCCSNKAAVTTTDSKLAVGVVAVVTSTPSPDKTKAEVVMRMFGDNLGLLRVGEFESVASASKSRSGRCSGDN